LRYLFFLIACLLLGQCSAPIAGFDSGKDAMVVPATITFKNTSKNATEYTWLVDNKEVSTEEHLSHTFLSSGRHVVELQAFEGAKIQTTKKEVIVRPPTECLVQIETTQGNLIVSLNEDTPRHLKNFSELVESGFYNGLIFHRVIENFMIQGGGNEYRSGGRRYPDPKTIEHEIKQEWPHYRGALAAARMPDDMNPTKASSGSQFYIVDGRKLSAGKMEKIQDDKLFNYTEEQIAKYLEVGGAPQLDGEYTVFGHLLIGYDVLDRIAEATSDSYDKPLQDITITNTKFLN